MNKRPFQRVAPAFISALSGFERGRGCEKACSRRWFLLYTGHSLIRVLIKLRNFLMGWAFGPPFFVSEDHKPASIRIGFSVVLEKRIEDLIAPTIDDMGFEVVRVMIMGTRTMRLQVMAERKDGSGISVEDCAIISRAISAVMDVEDPIEDAYHLEVSSPGLDRPLTRPKDFVRFKGFLAKVELFDALDGQRRFQGHIVDSDDETVSLNVDGDLRVLPFAEMKKSKLVLTDELLASATKEG